MLKVEEARYKPTSTQPPVRRTLKYRNFGIFMTMASRDLIMTTGFQSVWARTPAPLRTERITSMSIRTLQQAKSTTTACPINRSEFALYLKIKDTSIKNIYPNNHHNCSVSHEHHQHGPDRRREANARARRMGSDICK